MKKRHRVRCFLRWLGNGTCMLLIGLTVVLWVRSYRNYDVRSWIHEEGGLVYRNRPFHLAESRDGALAYTGGTEAVATPMAPFFWGSNWHLDWARRPNGFGVSIRCPHWFVILLLVLLPASVQAIGPVRRMRRVARRRCAGRCVACGYDLKGNVSGRCPECGRAVAPAV